MMSRTNYGEIALRINTNRRFAPPRIRSYFDKLTYDLADYFDSTPDPFDRDRFLIAAGVPRTRPAAKDEK